MHNGSKKIVVTSVMHGDTGIITAFFDELPGLIVQGNSEDDVSDKLTVLLQSYIKRLQSIGQNFEINHQTV